MKIPLYIVSVLILFGCGFLLSCANDRDGECNVYTFSGVLIIDKIDIKEYDGEKRKIIYGTFDADRADAPKELKPANLKEIVGVDDFQNIKPGKKFYLKIVNVYGGSCPPGPVFEKPDKWREIP